MTRGPHDRSYEQWESLDALLSKFHLALESSDANAVLCICLEALTQSDELAGSGPELLETLFEYVGPGRGIPVDSEKLAAILTRKIGNGIPAEDEKCQEFRVGNIWYRLRPEYGVLLESVQEPDGNWTFGSMDEPLRVLACGPSREAAVENWRNQVHVRFQQLVRNRPFRMSEDEKADWAVLSELIDVEHYWKTTPFRHLETGWVSAIREGVWEITWLGTDHVEAIGADAVPDEFAGYQKDQWFEALVERDRDTFSLQKIIHCRAIDPIDDMTEEEMEAWFSSLPTTDTLPKSDTDWNTL